MCKTHKVDNWLTRVLLEKELILRDVPVANGFFKRFFKNKLASSFPHLDDPGFAFVQLLDVRIDHAQQEATVVGALCVMAARIDLIELVERNFVLQQVQVLAVVEPFIRLTFFIFALLDKRL